MIVASLICSTQKSGWLIFSRQRFMFFYFLLNLYYSWYLFTGKVVYYAATWATIKPKLKKLKKFAPLPFPLPFPSKKKKKLRYFRKWNFLAPKNSINLLQNFKLQKT